MAKHQQPAWRGVRLLAALVILAAAFAFGTTSPVAAGAGTCGPGTGKCISSAGTVYDDKKCSGTQCVSCSFASNHICTGYGTDVSNYWDSTGGQH